MSFHPFLSPAFILEATKLYNSGQSLRSISIKLDIPKTSLRDVLLANGVALRAHARQPYQFTGITKHVSIRNALYGFCLVDGKLVSDPREMKVVQLILDWSQKGMSHGDIARKLNDKKLFPRKAKLWKQPLVSIIIKRHKEQNKNGGLT